jgi:DNA/RNA endonuclease YhcR with UshA esterase domain
MKKLLVAAFAIAIFGIFLLLLIANLSYTPLIEIKKLDKSMLEKTVRIEGEIFAIKSYEEWGFQIISVTDSTGTINVITDAMTSSAKGQKIIVQGIVEEYQGELQIKAENIIIQTD